MANPQKELGNVGIANDIFDMLCRTRIPGEARQVLDVIFRQTYGWQKKKDGIALTSFSARTGLNKAAVCRGIKTLKEMNLIIIEKDNAQWNTYEFNKDFNTWKPLSKKITARVPLSKKIMSIIEKDNLPLSKKIPSINNYTKNTITKNTSINIKIDEIKKWFEKIWGVYPVKKEKKKAWEIFQKINPENFPKILKAITDQKLEKQNLTENNQFCPEWKHPTTWLRGECWNDEITPLTAEVTEMSTDEQNRIAAKNLQQFIKKMSNG